MSKMSQMHMELSEEAYAMGYTTLEEALLDGWEVDHVGGDKYTLVKTDPQELAHKQWLRERNELLERVRNQLKTFENMHYMEPALLLDDIIKFIEKGVQ